MALEKLPNRLVRCSFLLSRVFLKVRRSRRSAQHERPRLEKASNDRDSIAGRQTGKTPCLLGDHVRVTWKWYSNIHEMHRLHYTSCRHGRGTYGLSHVSIWQSYPALPYLNPTTRS